MKYTITTYDKNGDEIVSRDYTTNKNLDMYESRQNYADQLESILEDSHTYLEEQALDNKE
jgi:dsDNA-binding SOS-regulon protein